MALHGWSQVDIAQYLEIAQSTVSRDLKAIQQQWKESAIRDFDLDRQQELQRLSMLEKEYWAGWERSQQSKETSLTEKLATGRDEAGQTLGRVKLATRSEQKVGDAIFLSGIQKVIDTRCKLLGLYPDSNSNGDSHAPTGNGAGLSESAADAIRKQILGIPQDVQQQ